MKHSTAKGRISACSRAVRESSSARTVHAVFYQLLYVLLDDDGVQGVVSERPVDRALAISRRLPHIDAPPNEERPAFLEPGSEDGPVVSFQKLLAAFTRLGAYMLRLSPATMWGRDRPRR